MKANLLSRQQPLALALFLAMMGCGGKEGKKATLAGFLPGKRIIVEVDMRDGLPEDRPSQKEAKALQFEKDGTFNFGKVVAGKFISQGGGLTYKVSGLKAVVSEDGEEDGGVTFPSPNPKIGDKIKFGPEKRQMDATISMVEAASPVEERPAPVDDTGDEHKGAESDTNAEPLKGQPDLPTLTNALPSPTTPGETAPIATEAVPVAAMLYAAEASDLNGFRNAYSSEIREGKEQANWEKNLKEAHGNVKTRIFATCIKAPALEPYRLKG